MNKRFQVQSWLNNLPYVVLYHFGRFWTGVDAIAFGEYVSREIMAFKCTFWKILGV